MNNHEEFNIQAMIISVGGTPAPIIKSICEYKPEFVSFFASQDTSDHVKSIKDEVLKSGINFKSELTLADDVNDLFHCHGKAEEAVRRVLSRGYGKESVIVDYTGGTKNMSVALALAAINQGFCFSYVGGKERTKNGTGIVIKGQEEIYHCINPWDFLAVEERKKIATLFNQYQFKAAKEIIDNLYEKNVNKKALFKKLGYLVQGYYMWDLFRHRDALSCFERAKVDEITKDDDEQIHAFARETNKKMIFLKVVIPPGNNGKNPSMPYMLDLYANAERRYGEGKVDDAILRIYRLVEMGAQERLWNKYSIHVSDVKTNQIPDILKNDFEKHKSKRGGKIKIPLTAAFDLLHALGNELGSVFEKRKEDFLSIQSARNYSYLAHGFESAKEKTYISLRDFVLSLDLFKQEEAPSFPKMDL